jgi:hypothetical protein
MYLLRSSKHTNSKAWLGINRLTGLLASKEFQPRATEEELRRCLQEYERKDRGISTTGYFHVYSS